MILGCREAVATTGVSKLLMLLIAIQSAALASFGEGPDFDPKYYVDIPLRFNLNETARAFDALPRFQNNTIASNTLEQFVMQYFDTAGSDLIASTPRDYNPSPTNFLPRVQNVTVRKWALQIHELWLELTRKVSPSVAMHPEKHTLVPLNCSVVVPGARFKEVYYWDSYWVIKGLLVSGMTETAQGIVENLMELVERYGFVPNGARVYYENRSQPPLLSQMIRAVYTKTRDLTLLKRSLPILLKEDQQNMETLRTSMIIPVDLNVFLFQMEKNIEYFGKILVNQIVETRFANAAKDRYRAIQRILWSRKNGQWFDAWLSYDECSLSETNKRTVVVYEWVQKRLTYASNFVPLWAGVLPKGVAKIPTPFLSFFALYMQENAGILLRAVIFMSLRILHGVPGDVRKERVVEALRTSGLIQSASVATSLRNTGQQWDFPNAWAPLVDMVIEGLDASGLTRGRSMAREISRDWLRSNFVAYQQVGKMIEKYDATSCGKIGGVGEYNPQTGFGWSNGVVLSLLQKYGWPADEPMFCPEPLS